MFDFQGSVLYLRPEYLKLTNGDLHAALMLGALASLVEMDTGGPDLELPDPINTYTFMPIVGGGLEEYIFIRLASGAARRVLKTLYHKGYIKPADFGTRWIFDAMYLFFKWCALTHRAPVIGEDEHDAQ